MYPRRTWPSPATPCKYRRLLTTRPRLLVMSWSETHQSHFRHQLKTAIKSTRHMTFAARAWRHPATASSRQGSHWPLQPQWHRHTHRLHQRQMSPCARRLDLPPGPISHTSHIPGVSSIARAKTSLKTTIKTYPRRFASGSSDQSHSCTASLRCRISEWQPQACTAPARLFVELSTLLWTDERVRIRRR